MKRRLTFLSIYFVCKDRVLVCPHRCTHEIQVYAPAEDTYIFLMLLYGPAVRMHSLAVSASSSVSPHEERSLKKSKNAKRRQTVAGGRSDCGKTVDIGRTDCRLTAFICTLFLTTVRDLLRQMHAASCVVRVEVNFGTRMSYV